MKNLLIASALALCLWGADNYTAPAAIKEVKTTVSYTVHTGDTLWSIAGKMQDKYQDKRDIREIIYFIRQHNGASCLLVPGQKLNIEVVAAGK